MTTTPGTTQNTPAFPADAWIIATKSGDSGQGTCVSVNLALRDQDMIGLRHSTRPELGAMVYTCDEWAAFLDGAKNGEFDL